MEETKRCIICGLEKPLSAFFREKRIKCGRRGNCKQCQQPYLRTWRERTKKRRALYDKEYYHKNKPIIRQRRKAYLQHWYLTNKERIKKQQREYNIKNKEGASLRTLRYMNKKLSLEATLTTEQWNTLKLVFKNRCAYCGKKTKRLEKEHIIPVSQGGAFSLYNIVPACRSCNAKKKNNLPIEPIKLVLL